MAASVATRWHGSPIPRAQIQMSPLPLMHPSRKGNWKFLDLPTHSGKRGDALMDHPARTGSKRNDSAMPKLGKPPEIESASDHDTLDRLLCRPEWTVYKAKTICRHGVATAFRIPVIVCERDLAPNPEELVVAGYADSASCRLADGHLWAGTLKLGAAQRSRRPSTCFLNRGKLASSTIIPEIAYYCDLLEEVITLRTLRGGGCERRRAV
jgi:hypothetical protein